jgi:hypothetical protein
MSAINCIKQGIELNKDNRNFTYLAILELDERVRALESHEHKTLNVDETTGPILQPAKPDPIEKAVDAFIVWFNHIPESHKLNVRAISNKVRETITEAVKEGSRGK